MKDIMCDLETLGVSSNAVIASIGACRFNIQTGDIGDTFYRNITRESCEAFGLTCDDRTLEWWSQQSKEAQDALKVDQVALHIACEDFRQWVKGMSSNQKLWGNGIGFDNVILRNAFNKCQVPFPIHFRNDMDVRTIVRLGPKSVKKNEPRVGVHHNALDDAIFQVGYVSKIYRRLKGFA